MLPDNCEGAGLVTVAGVHRDNCEGAVPSPGPRTRCKLRTISCSTEESGFDSLSTVSSLPSVSSPPRTSPHGGPSSPESETSDYRSSPSPSLLPSSSRPPREIARKPPREIARKPPRRRATVPPCSTVCVSLPKLSLPQPDSCPAKKIKLENHSSLPSQNAAADDCKLRKVLPRVKREKLKKETKDEDSLSKQFKSEHMKADDMKLELAKLDNILQGKLLFNQASHKLSDMLLLDNVKQEQFEADECKKIVKDDTNINNNNEEENNVKESTKDLVESTLESVECKWENCNAKIELQHLLEHLTNVHIATQKTQETDNCKYQCLWKGCKVYSTCSTSFTWLSKHVTRHVGNKPFICIVDGCKQRFGNQVSLSRHVNSHFKTPGNCSSNAARKHSSISSSPIKFYIRKTRRKLRSGVETGQGKVSEKNDLFHLGIMAGIKDGLSRFNKTSPRSPPLMFESCGSQLVFQSQVKSRKLDENGNVHYLVSWLPSGMFEDEWVSKKELKMRRKVAISQLPPPLKAGVQNHIFGRQTLDRNRRKLPKLSGPPKLT